MEKLKKIGFSNGDIIKMTWLAETSKTPLAASDLYQLYLNRFPLFPIGYEYIVEIANQMEQYGELLFSHNEQNRKYYLATEKGLVTMSDYHKLYKDQLNEIIIVIDRIYYELTKIGAKPAPVENPLPPQFRRFLAKLISVKDITRYMIFKLGETRSEFYAAEALDLMKATFGWAPSNGYFYDIVREMEHEQTIVGKWKDEEKRTIRLIKVTDDGAVFAKQITQSLTKCVRDVRIHLNSILSLTL